MSVSKDRAVIIGIWNRPPNLTKEAFETKITSLVHSALALPIAQRNYLKFEIVDDSVLCYDLPSSFRKHRLVCGLLRNAQYVVPDHKVLQVHSPQAEEDFAQIFEDPTFSKLLLDAQEDLYGDRRNDTANVFSVDIETRIDLPAPKDCARLVSAFPRPANLSAGEYHPKMRSFADRLAAPPITQKHALKYSLWLPNNTLNVKLRDLGFPEPEPLVVAML
ncbi:hypothetical protein B0H14DRAFT_3140857 [Mycena olivaceomarginata]|nr:hypothetical protein B0H14DRAFT_3140857 [Mycena olivaceomarginata]